MSAVSRMGKPEAQGANTAGEGQTPKAPWNTWQVETPWPSITPLTESRWLAKYQPLQDARCRCRAMQTFESAGGGWCASLVLAWMPRGFCSGASADHKSERCRFMHRRSCLHREKHTFKKFPNGFSCQERYCEAALPSHRACAACAAWPRHQS